MRTARPLLCRKYVFIYLFFFFSEGELGFGGRALRFYFMICEKKDKETGKEKMGLKQEGK